MMNINEDENTMALFQQDTQAFNQEADEDLTVEEYKEISCEAQSDSEPQMDNNAMSKLDQQGKSKVGEILQAMKKATPEQLKEEKRKIKQALASKNSGEMKEQEFLASSMIFGVSVGWALFIAVSAIILGFIVYYLVKSWLRNNPDRRRNCSDPIL